MKCILIEDEIPAQIILKNYIAKIKSLQLVATFQTALDANVYLKNNSIDVLFLDINLPDVSGLDFIKTITNLPAIIMTTAYPNYAAESYEESAIKDYLVKPFSFERFLKAINKLEDKQETLSTGSVSSLDNFIFVNVDKTQHKLYFKDIIYIESERNYVIIATKKGKLTYIASLKEWIEKLPKEQFAQNHKSYIVNCSEVTKLTGNTVFVAAVKLPIGRLYKKALLSKLGI